VDKTAFLAEPVCKVCGKQLYVQTQELCEDCRKQKHSFKQGKALLEYEGDTRQSLWRFKYKGRAEYGECFGRLIAEYYRKWLAGLGIEAVIPIPLHPSRRRRRGYNQAELLARPIAHELHVPLRTDLLVRAKRTRPQKELDDKNRKNNLKNAFKYTQKELQLDKVLLVDDIYTTGSTLDEASLTLQHAGIREVYAVYAAVGRGD
jgi:ComF family protein